MDYFLFALSPAANDKIASVGLSVGQNSDRSLKWDIQWDFPFPNIVLDKGRHNSELKRDWTTKANIIPNVYKFAK